MSDREKLPELIDRYNSGNLTEEELSAFLEMLKNNSRLREEVRLDKELNEILADEDIIELRKKLLAVKKNTGQRKGADLKFFLLAASILLLIGLGVLLFINNKHHHPHGNIPLTHKYQPEHYRLPKINKVEKTGIAKDITTREIKKPDRRMGMMLAAGFRKNPAFENMLGATRHAGYFRMDAPALGYRFGEKAVIRFEWLQDGQTGINLKIMDNTGTIVHESALLVKNKYSLPPGTLKAGLYYFEVLENDEILFFGKFFIK
jgi:hypothetical protein